MINFKKAVSMVVVFSLVLCSCGKGPGNLVGREDSAAGAAVYEVGSVSGSGGIGSSGIKGMDTAFQIKASADMDNVVSCPQFQTEFTKACNDNSFCEGVYCKQAKLGDFQCRDILLQDEVMDSQNRLVAGEVVEPATWWSGVKKTHGRAIMSRHKEAMNHPVTMDYRLLPADPADDRKKLSEALKGEKVKIIDLERDKRDKEKKAYDNSPEGKAKKKEEEERQKRKDIEEGIINGQYAGIKGVKYGDLIPPPLEELRLPNGLIVSCNGNEGGAGTGTGSGAGTGSGGGAAIELAGAGAAAAARAAAAAEAAAPLGLYLGLGGVTAGIAVAERAGLAAGVATGAAAATAAAVIIFVAVREAVVGAVEGAVEGAATRGVVARVAGGVGGAVTGAVVGAVRGGVAVAEREG